MGDFLAGLGFWAWIILGALLMALETLIPGVHFLWFGLAAVLVGSLCFGLAAIDAAGWLTLPMQFVLFAAVSVVTVVWVRNFARDGASVTDEPDLNARLSQLKGRVVVVDEAISGGRGKVRVGDTLWTAEGLDAPVGASVRVTGASGTALRVEPA